MRTTRRSLLAIPRSCLVLPLALVLAFALAAHGHAQAEPVIQWDRTYGGADGDTLRSVRELPDGDLLVVGTTFSFAEHGDRDIILYRLAADGDLRWRKTYGGAGTDVLDWTTNLVLADDGGFVVAGSTRSFDAGGWDVYLFKTNGTGEMEWQKTYGGLADDYGSGVRRTADGGYVVTGMTFSFQGSANDMYLVKTDGNGEMEWQRAYDHFAQQTPDGGYLLVGELLTGPAGSSDAFVARTDSAGVPLWTESYGGAGDDWATSFRQTRDGAVVVSGYTTSFGAGSSDGWLFKLRELGAESMISGRVYIDRDDDDPGQGSGCVFDDGDQPFARRWVRADPGPYLALTDSDGRFEMRVEPGTYTVGLVGPVDDPFTVAACQTEPQRTVEVLAGAAVGDVDFGVGVPPACPSLCSAALSVATIYDQIQLSGACLNQGPTSACPDVEQVYRITLTNDGCPALQPGSLLSFNLIPGMQLVSATDATQAPPCRLIPSPLSPPPPATIWELDNALPVGNTCVLDVRVKPDAGGCPSSGPPYLTASFTGTCQGQANTSALGQSDPDEKCDCSCDPNDKQVTPAGCGPYGNVRPDQTLTYRVRFHNVGLGPAHDVVVRDALDDDLDATRLELLTSSHPISGLEIAPGGELVIRFDGIELPATASGPTRKSTKPWLPSAAKLRPAPPSTCRT